MSQHLDILHQSQRLSIVFLQMESWNRGLCTKNDNKQNFWAHLKRVMVCDLRKNLLTNVDIYRDMKGSHLTFCVISKWKTCLFRSFTHNAHAKQLTFQYVPWKQRPRSNKNIPNHCTTWTSANQGVLFEISVIFFTCSMYLHLFEMAIDLWLGYIGDTTEFQFAFRSKSTRNCIFEANNFDFLSVRGTAVSVVPFVTVTWPRHATRPLSNGK